MQPLVIDLYCGLGGWTEGFLAEGYRVVGFDIERHDYGTGGYPGQLVLQDVTTLHGRQFRDAAVIVASPPCQAYSYRAMPWSRAKALPPPDNTLFETCWRIQSEASEAAGRYIPLIVENVRGAQKWVGTAKWHFGSYYLWGDVPALMPMTFSAIKVPSFRFDGSGQSFQTASVRRTNPGNGARFTSRDCGVESVKVPGISFSGYGSPDYKPKGFNVTAAQRYREATKGVGIGSVSWGQGKGQRHPNDPRNFWSKSNSRKAASAAIAKIPFPLAQHIARCFKPEANQ